MLDLISTSHLVFIIHKFDKKTLFFFLKYNLSNILLLFDFLYRTKKIIFIYGFSLFYFILVLYHTLLYLVIKQILKVYVIKFNKLTKIIICDPTIL